MSEARRRSASGVSVALPVRGIVEDIHDPAVAEVHAREHFVELHDESPAVILILQPDLSPGVDMHTSGPDMGAMNTPDAGNEEDVGESRDLGAGEDAAGAPKTRRAARVVSARRQLAMPHGC